MEGELLGGDNGEGDGMYVEMARGVSSGAVVTDIMVDNVYDAVMPPQYAHLHIMQG